MAFKQLPGNQGMIYVPEKIPDKKKHPCPDCFSCQWCGNERCRNCRSKICCKRKKCRRATAETEQDSPVPEATPEKENYEKPFSATNHLSP